MSAHCYRCLLIDRLGFEKIVEPHQGAMTIRYAANNLGEVLFVHFELDGEEVRDGEWFLRYREKGSRQHLGLDRIVAKPVPPSLDTLARSLFALDPDVRSFVNLVSDSFGPWVPKTMREDEFPLERRREFRHEREVAAREKAWERDERGWRTRATKLAERLLGELASAEQARGK